MSKIDRGTEVIRPAALLALATPWLSGCEAIAGIFKAGVWVGVLGIAVVLALLFGVTRLFSRRT